jgi:L-fuconolactonase
MTVVDSHLHLWDLSTGEYAWNTPALGRVHASFTGADAGAALAAAGIDSAVLVQAADTVGDTRRLLQVAREEPWAAGVVAWVPLEVPSRAETLLDLWTSEGGAIVGVRQLVHDDPRADLLDSPEVRRTLGDVARRGLPFDAPDAWPRLWPALTRLVDGLPELQVIVDHLGKPPLGDKDPAATATWEADLRDLARRPNVVAKLSGLGGLLAVGSPVTSAAMRRWVDLALDAFGPDRLMFGGDWPVSLAHAELADTVGAVRGALDELSLDEREAVLGGTATRVYRLGGASTAAGQAAAPARATPATAAASSRLR